MGQGIEVPHFGMLCTIGACPGNSTLESLACPHHPGREDPIGRSSRSYGGGELFWCPEINLSAVIGDAGVDWSVAPGPDEGRGSSYPPSHATSELARDEMTHCTVKYSGSFNHRPVGPLED